MELKRNIGKRIKELRKKRGLSQERLAEMVNIEQNTLSYIETGINFCSAETLENIIEALEITPEELFIFAHFEKSNNELVHEISEILLKNPDKIPEVYKIVRSIVN